MVIEAEDWPFVDDEEDDPPPHPAMATSNKQSASGLIQPIGSRGH